MVILITTPFITRLTTHLARRDYRLRLLEQTHLDAPPTTTSDACRITANPQYSPGADNPCQCNRLRPIRQRFRRGQGWRIHRFDIFDLTFDNLAYQEYEQILVDLYELRRQLRPYTGAAGDVRLRRQIAGMYAAKDAVGERAFGREVAGQPTIKRTMRLVEGAYLRRNAGYPTVEHIVPVTAGGGDDDANLSIAHHGCNVLWSDNGKNIAIENRTEAFLAWREERQHARKRHWDEARIQAVAKFLADERRRRADLVALWTRDDLLRRELRLLGDRLRITTSEEDRVKIQDRRGANKTNREKIRRRINRLEAPDLVIGQIGMLCQPSVAGPDCRYEYLGPAGPRIRNHDDDRLSCPTLA